MRREQKGATNMAYVWTPDLSTGDAVIDDQHKQLFAAVNALFDAYQSGKERQEVERTMEFLVKYTAKHFADEEKLQEKYEYPDFFAHKQLHAEFTEMVQRLVTKMSRDGPTENFIIEVCTTIGEWLFLHVKGEDSNMAAYIQRKAQTV